jgi:hypothetical protein
MDNELKQSLEAICGRIQAIEQNIQSMEARLVGRIDQSAKAVEERLTERIRDSETALLTEFHKWASPIETRLRTHSTVPCTMDADLEYLQDRVKKLEDRPSGN